MNEVKVLDEFFVSTILGKKIYDSSGRRVGAIRDFAVHWDAVCPRVSGIKYAKDVHELISISEIGEISPKGIILKSDFAQTKFHAPRENEIFVKKWLLDKQIVDLKGSKLVRVNDIKLSWVKRNGFPELLLLAVDVGVRGLIRRIFGYDPKTEKVPMNLVGWQHIEPIRSRTANLTLTESNEKFSRLHPADIAEIIEELDHYERPEFINTLDDQTAAEALGEVDLETQVNIIENLDSERASRILEEMAPDEAADLLGELTQEKSDELLNLMEPDEAEDVRELMEYADDTAGALMTTEYISFTFKTTAQEAIDKLRAESPSAEIIYYLYVLDEDEKLLGVVSLRDLIIAKPHTIMGDIMQDRVITVLAGDNHQDVLDTIAKYDIIAVPVTDNEGHMQGVITVDDVLNTIMPDRKRLESFSYFLMRKAFGKR
jgi:CBS domain-containing protein/sporulation protein YlmC with PRC-barrel domain